MAKTYEHLKIFAAKVEETFEAAQFDVAPKVTKRDFLVFAKDFADVEQRIANHYKGQEYASGKILEIKEIDIPILNPNEWECKLKEVADV